MTMVKYAGETDEQALDTLTWSVIDLSKTARVAEMFDRFMEVTGHSYATAPLWMMVNASMLNNTFEFGLGEDAMRDLGDIFYDFAVGSLLEKELYQGMMDSLEECVVYNVRGNGRSGASGLSFCYAADFSPDELNTYTRNCPFPHYLSFLDAINPAWSAPDWVYEQAKRLPGIEEIPEYEMTMSRFISKDGMPGLSSSLGENLNCRSMHVDLYWLNPKTDCTVQLGSTVVMPDYDDDYNSIYLFDQFGQWPAIEGVLCNVRLVGDGDLSRRMYSIPVQIGGDNYQLRCGFDQSREEPLTVYGLWEGYEADSSVFNRNVVQLSQLSGQEFFLLYPIDGTGESGEKRYETSEPLTMYRFLEMTAKPLPAGTYYLDYWVEDLFTRRLDSGRVEVFWDGQAVSVQSGDWQGTVTLKTPF